VPRKSDSRRPTIDIVGPGNLGSALALALHEAGYRVTAIAVRPGSKSTRRARALARTVSAKLTQLGGQPLTGDVVWLSVPDDNIATVASNLAESGDWKGKIIFHSSGALTSGELTPLRAKGARVASVHPMMTFVQSEVPQMAGVAFALEGDVAALRAAQTIVEDLGGNPFVIRKQNKVLYHVFGSFASPLVIALMATMEEVAAEAGIRKRDVKSVMVPLLWQTLRNYLKHDAALAFSGPLARGDVATIQKHLRELDRLPHASEVYTALAKAAVKNLPVRNQRSIAKELDR
jgi:predicted short-subunit dehydrogenase-like oxidoreductase (DUF2520 family)